MRHRSSPKIPIAVMLLLTVLGSALVFSPTLVGGDLTSVDTAPTIYPVTGLFAAGQTISLSVSWGGTESAYTVELWNNTAPSCIGTLRPLDEDVGPVTSSPGSGYNPDVGTTSPTTFTFTAATSSDLYICASVEDLTTLTTLWSGVTDYTVTTPMTSYNTDGENTVAVNSGQSVVLTDYPSGGAPPYTYQWYYPAGYSAAVPVTCNTAGTGVSSGTEDPAGASNPYTVPTGTSTSYPDTGTYTFGVVVTGSTFGTPDTICETVAVTTTTPAAISDGGATVDQTSATGIEVTITESDAPDNTHVTATSMDWGTTQPSGTGSVSLGTSNSPAAYYDVQIEISSYTSGIAQVCITNTAMTSAWEMMYAVGTAWDYASPNPPGGVVQGTTICGYIPVMYLDGTPIVIGTPQTTTTTTTTSSTTTQSSSTTTTASVGCGTTITTDTTLSGDIGPCSGDGLTIGANSITLNCAGFTITGEGSSSSEGIQASDFNGVVIKNCIVKDFYYGFVLIAVTSDTLVGNNAFNNWWGFLIGFSSSHNTFSGNVANGNGYTGFGVYASNIHYAPPSPNTFTANTANANGFYGFVLDNTSANVLTGNTANGNNQNGLYIAHAYSNTLTGNTANSNTQYGYSDLSIGSGTLGTADIYTSDICNGNGAGGSSPDGLCTSGTSTTTTTTRTTIIIPWRTTTTTPATTTTTTQTTITTLPSVTSTTTSTTGGTVVAVSCMKTSVTVGTTFSCKATVSGSKPTGTVDWSSSSSGKFSKLTCKLSKGACSVKFTPTATGSSVVIKANYEGNSKNSPSAGMYSLEVTKQDTTIYLSCTRRSVVAGSPTVIKCTADPDCHSWRTCLGPYGSVSWSQTGTGSVSFSSTTCTLTNGECSVTLTGATAGKVTLNATYTGDSNNNGSSKTVTLTIKT